MPQIVRLDQQTWLEYQPAWLPAADASAALVAVLHEVRFERRSIHLFGRTVPQPRRIAWSGSVSYTYSRDTLAPRPHAPTVAALLYRVIAASGDHPFNHVLLNLYRDGRDSMGWHADDEPELGDEPLVASLSLGAARRFRWRPRPGVDGTAGHLDLEHGSLLWMRGRMQARYKHELPKQTGVVQPRLNLTFRCICDIQQRTATS